MPFGLLEGLAALGAGTSLYNTFFGGDDEAQLKKSIEALLKRGRQGIDENVLKNLTRTTKARIGTQTSAERATAENRLLRQGAPMQVVEQILGDIGVRGGQRADTALTDIAFRNEMEKMNALRAAGGLSQGLQRWNPSAGLGESLLALLQSPDVQGLFSGGAGQQPPPMNKSLRNINKGRLP